ncbi:MAG TPA: exo-alpha-sialidase [Candidatus Hydrogenedentes bacterium]|nr:exo-alpha-sialidase [Candidatus Hydrogenedentota bacterium]
MLYITLLLSVTVVSGVTVVDYDVQLDVIRSGYDGKQCWVHARAGAVPGAPPVVVMTMQKLLLSGSDVFYGLHLLITENLGASWTMPVEQTSLARRRNPDDTETVVCDFTPKWHAPTERLLGTGHTAQYRNNKLVPNRRRATAYAVYDTDRGAFLPWRELEMPLTAVPPENDPFFNSGAGSTQRVDLPTGDILLPVYHKSQTAEQYSSSVLRCAFDGEILSVREHGAPLSVPVKRGLYEPSLAAFQGRYYFTLRNDDAGYVTASDDGLHFETPRVWRFDDGEPLGNYNTQQHWVVHSEGLFLVYTRRGADNDHVFRCRAPLFMAQIDPDGLRVIRATERILVPQRGARLGNFGVTRVSDAETWVTATEWMQPVGCEEHGSDNSVYAARIRWK